VKKPRYSPLLLSEGGKTVQGSRACGCGDIRLFTWLAITHNIRQLSTSFFDTTHQKHLFYYRLLHTQAQATTIIIFPCYTQTTVQRAFVSIPTAPLRATTARRNIITSLFSNILLAQSNT
jgi:hypothetical protein